MFAILAIVAIAFVAALVGFTFIPGVITARQLTPQGIAVSVTGFFFSVSGSRPATGQFQRAPDVAGAPGSWANVGASWTDPADGTGPVVTHTDYPGGVIGTLYWYRASWTVSGPVTEYSDPVQLADGGNTLLKPWSRQRG